MSVFNRRRKSGVTRIIHDRYNPTSKTETWYEICDRVRERDRYTCTHPGCNKYLGKHGGHIHHIIKLSRGGTTTMSNLALLCEEHHEEKHPHMRNSPRR